ncbi:hypothetical protein OUZ56_032444 [Daphnia magna]|uniref:Peptidase S8/S53 domain-containing protein n=1 Tax=Daphnia magna TaxID=35525 RepID=A0ABR0B8X1_9CRUS|nr:hypothetical protein OUZ56_032444 [Daphnia magna]
MKKSRLATVVGFSVFAFASTASAGPTQQGPSFLAPEHADGSDTLVLDLRDDLSEAERDALAAEIGVPLVDASPHVTDDGQVFLTHAGAAQRAAIQEKLRGDARVEAVEPLVAFDALFTPDDPRFAEQWHLSRVGAESAWNRATGTGVVVAVIDTGVACADDAGFTKGTDLQGTPCVAGWNFVTDDDKPWDDHGHGSHVAGTIAQTTNNGVGTAGLAFGATLMPVKVLAKNGSGSNAQVADGIRWAADHGAQVINLSLGGPFPSSVVGNAVKYAQKKGVLVVAAAGNSGRSVGYPAGFPASSRSVLRIATTALHGSRRGARGRDRGTGRSGASADGLQRRPRKIMASPHVAGAAALLISQGVTAPDAVKARLYDTARPKDDPKLFGAGILDAGAAVGRTAMLHDVVRALALAFLGIGLARWIHQKRGTFVKAGPWVGAALFGAAGLVPFVHALGLPGMAGPAARIVDLLGRPLGDMDLVSDVSFHKFALLALPLPTIAAFLFAFQAKSLRPIIGGLALGQAAYLVSMVLFREQAFFLGTTILTALASAGTVACLWIARVALDEKTA